jgi:ABC-type nitrate/sulfonate/bicarbonate transport system permease component
MLKRLLIGAAIGAALGVAIALLLWQLTDKCEPMTVFAMPTEACR